MRKPSRPPSGATGRASTDATRASGGGDSVRTRVQRGDAGRVALDVDQHARAVVAHGADEAERDRVPVHERAEADALHGAGDAEQRADHRGLSRSGAAGRPTSMSTMRVPPNVVRSTTMPSGSAAISPMRAASPPSGCARIAPQRGVGLVGRDDRDDLALVGHVAADRCRAGRTRRSPPGATGSVGLVEDDGQAGVARQLVADGADAAPRGIAQPPRRAAPRSAGRRPARPAGRCRSGCRPRARGRRGRASPPSRGRRWCPRRARRHRVRTRAASSIRPGGDDADARGGDEQAVGRAAVRPPWCRR